MTAASGPTDAWRPWALRTRVHRSSAPDSSGLACKPCVGGDLVAAAERDRTWLPPVHLHQARLEQIQAIKESRDLAVRPQRRGRGGLGVDPPDSLADPVLVDVACRVVDREPAACWQHGNK